MKSVNNLTKKTYSYMYVLPGLFLFALLFVIPSLGSFYYAFTYYDGFKISGFAGLANFKEIILDMNNSICFKNTLIFTIVTVVGRVVIGLMLALFVNINIKSKYFLRSMLFFPVILSSVSIGVAFTAILNPEIGLLNVVLRGIGLDIFAQDWLVNPKIVIISCALVDVWRYAGFHMAVFLAGLQTISKDYYEAADIDGATKWDKFKNITIPSLLPVINTNVVFALIGGLKVLDAVYILTGGGPGNSSQVISSVVLKNFGQGRYGEATAANVVLFVIVALIVVFVNNVIGRKETEV